MIVIPPLDITLDASNVVEDKHPDWDSGTSYSTGDRVFYTGTTPHRIYEALTTTTGDVPPDNPGKWALVKTSNRWAMFDGSTSSVTSNSSKIDVTLSISSRADRVAFFGLQADTVDVTVKETDGTVIDSTTYDTSGQSVFVARLPGLRQAVEIDLVLSAATAKCAQVAVGFSRDLGGAEFGYSSGIQDFSKRNVNDFGETTLVKRNFGKTLEVQTFLRKTSTLTVDKRVSALADLRATPVAWDALGLPNSGFSITQKESLVLFGFYRRFTVTHESFNTARLTLEIEGMT